MDRRIQLVPPMASSGSADPLAPTLETPSPHLPIRRTPRGRCMAAARESARTADSSRVLRHRSGWTGFPESLRVDTNVRFVGVREPFKRGADYNPRPCLSARRFLH